MRDSTRPKKLVEKAPFDCDRQYEPERVEQWEIVTYHPRLGFHGLTLDGQLGLPQVLRRIKVMPGELVDLAREVVPT